MALTAFTKTCAKHTPGSSRLILFDITTVETATIDDGELKVLTLDAATDAVEIEIDRDSLVFMSEGTGTKNGVAYVTQSVEFNISKINKAAIDTINSIMNQSACGMGALVYTNNKTWISLGLETVAADTIVAAQGIHGMFAASTAANGGTDPTQEDGDVFAVRLEGVFPDHVIPVMSSSTVAVGATLITAAA